MVMQVFSQWLIKLWNEWELRATVLLSLSLQLVLILLGSQRKYRKGTWISIILWLSYLSADWIATVALGILANGNGDSTNDTAMDPKIALQAFWAPFLLLHLGGPDTITAYSLEDNELWLRHLLMLVVQLTVAFYVYLKSLSNDAITFIAVPMFIAGITKYGERTWVLRSASAKQFEDSLLSTPAELAYQRLLGFESEQHWEKSSSFAALTEVYLNPQSKSTPYLYLHEGYFLFSMLRYLFANLSLSLDDAQLCYSIIGRKEPREAFKLIEVELGFLYDVLYTKATIVYSVVGMFLRTVTFLSSVSALIAFFAIVDNNKLYSPIDRYVTYALLIGAIALECYAVVMLILSDEALLWITKRHNLFGAAFISKAVSMFQSISTCNKKRCFGSIAQHNLINFCIKEKKSRVLRSDVLFSFCFMLKTYRRRTWEEKQNDDLEKLIFNNVHEKYEKYEKNGFDDRFLSQLLGYRGDNVLREKKCVEKFKWSVVEVEFNHSLLLWHIATDICYYNDLGKGEDRENRRSSKCLSDYMLYVLLMRPSMLPKWIGRIGYLQHTYKEAMRIFCSRELKVDAEACEVLIQTCTQIHPLETMKREKQSKSLLFDGCRLAEQLLEREDRWEIVIGVWLEILMHAASECGWRDHGQQLRRGGELLTKVCLLMANMGLSTQYQKRRWHFGSEANQVGWGWGRSEVQTSMMEMGYI